MIAVSGCVTKQRPVNVIKGKSYTETTTGGKKTGAKKKKGKVVWVQQPLEEGSVVRAADKDGDYLMNFENISIPDFIESMMSGVFKYNYMITEPVRSVSRRFTIKMTEDLEPRRAFSLFNHILAMHGVEVVEREGTYIFDISKKTGGGAFRGPILYGRRLPKSLPINKGEDITCFIPFYNIEAKTLKPLLDKQLPAQSVIFPIDPMNLLVISAGYDDIKYTLAFIDLLDRGQFKNKSILMLSPEYWDADEFKTKVEELLAAEGLQTEMVEKSKGILFIPVEKLNSLIIISPVKEWVERVLYWLEKLDVPEAAGEAKKVFSYKLKNVEVDSVYEILQAYAEGTEADMSRLGGSRGSRTGGALGQKDNKGGKTTTQRRSPSMSRARRTGAGGTDEMRDDVAIIPVLETNSIVIVATPVEYKKYADILRRIDVARQQVFVEVIIGNVTLDRSTQLGLEFWINRYLYNTQFGTKGGLGIFKGVDESGNNVAPTGSNFFLDGVLEGTQFEVLMNAMVEDSKINIISTPKITVVENEEAEISVGADVPVIASESAITGGQGANYIPFRSVQYINTGIILKVRPAILSDNKIALTLEQEISEALANQTSDISSPEILKRSIKTTLIVSEGEIAFIGGLFQKKLSTSQSGIPVLSKIPLLGNLFKNSGKQVKKTELVVFINSKVIRKHNDMKDIVDAVRKLYSGETAIQTDSKDKMETKNK